MSNLSVSTLVLHLEQADPASLDDAELVERLLLEIAQAVGLHVVASTSHRFTPQGLSAVLLLAESHVAVHTWPEEAGAYLTLTTCGPLGPEAVSTVESLVTAALGGRVRTEQVRL